MYLTIDDITSITGGTLIPRTYSTPSSICGVSIDSRKVEKNSLFISIVGNTVDSHSFIQQAIDNGASAVLANRNPFLGDTTVPVIIVSDTVNSLRLMAKAARSQTNAKVVGITGTAGKTTVKELAAKILETELCVAKNYLNYNTQIGMSVSILNAKGDENIWIMEVGISKPHDMDELGCVLEPNIALITNVGAAHIDGLGEKGVAYHKASLLKYLRDGGISIINADYPNLMKEAQKIRSSLLYSTKNKQVPYYGTYIGMLDSGKSIYRLFLDGESLDVITPFGGSFFTESILASAVVSHICGVSNEGIFNGLNNAELPKQRCNYFQVGSWVCIDDSYNANPLSMKKTIMTAFEVSEKKKPLIYVLGEMVELGKQTEKEHENLGYMLAKTGAKAIFWKGGQMEAMQFGLKRGGFSGIIQRISTEEEFKENFQNCKLDKGIIVFKGSRLNKMEVFVDAFIGLVDNNVI